MGAGGSRPALAWPSLRQPSASEAARAQTGGADGHGRQERVQPHVDAEGFTTVGRFRRPAARGPAAATREPATADGSNDITMEIRDQDDGGGEVDEDAGPGPAVEDVAWEPAEAEDAAAGAAADPSHLKRRWDLEKEVVALLRKQGRDDADEGLREAEARCAQAKAEWEGARRPPRLSHRLRKAENALQKARRAKEAAVQSLQDLHAKYFEDRSRLSSHWEDCVERFERRERELADLHRELAQPQGVEVEPRPASDDVAMREVAKGVDAVAPVLQSVLEALPEGSRGHGELASAIAQLANISGAAERAAADRDRGGARCFRMHGKRGREPWADAVDDVDSSDFDDSEGWGTRAEEEAGAATVQGGGSSATAGGGDNAQWAWQQQPWGQQAYWANQSWQHGSADHGGYTWGWHHGQHGQAAPLAPTDGHGVVDTGCEPECADEEGRERARRAYALQQAAIAQQTQGQGAGFASAEATAAAAQVHASRLAEVKREAAGNGIAFDDAALDAMSPHDLEQWARQYLQ